MDAVTLEEEVAEKMAQLLIEAARAREATAITGEPTPVATPPAEASALESEVIKWERRLNWWKHLRQRESAKT